MLLRNSVRYPNYATKANKSKTKPHASSVGYTVYMWGDCCEKVVDLWLLLSSRKWRNSGVGIKFHLSMLIYIQTWTHFESMANPKTIVLTRNHFVVNQWTGSHLTLRQLEITITIAEIWIFSLQMFASVQCLIRSTCGIREDLSGDGHCERNVSFGDIKWFAHL